MKIVIEKRRDDWIAYLENNKLVWECGESPQEALDKLIVSLDVLEVLGKI